MDTTNANISYPATNLTKLEYAAIELLARRRTARGTLINQEGVGDDVQWALETAAHLLDETSHIEAEYAILPLAKKTTFDKIERSIEEKDLSREEFRDLVMDLLIPALRKPLTLIALNELTEAIEAL